MGREKGREEKERGARRAVPLHSAFTHGQKKGRGKPRPYNGSGALVDVVLLPVEGGVGLDDDVFVRGLL
jgi:hypothetical protein